jgi:hypothetical protein
VTVHFESLSFGTCSGATTTLRVIENAERVEIHVLPSLRHRRSYFHLRLRGGAPAPSDRPFPSLHAAFRMR